MLLRKGHPVVAVPRLAPLPASMVFHALGLSEETFLEQILSRILLDRLTVLQQRLDAAFAHIYPIMEDVVQKKKLTLTWFQNQVAEQINQKSLVRQETTATPKVYSISSRTMLTWRENHVLLPPGSRHLDLDRAAAILAISMIDPRRQGYLPTGIDHGEPHKWCYAKTAPDAPVLPCPLPLPPRLRPGTLLFSHWPTFDKGWSVLRPPGMGTSELSAISPSLPIGAIRFSSLERTALARWDERFASREATLIFGSNLQKDVETLFHRLAPELLTPPAFPPLLPYVFDYHELYGALTTTRKK